MLVPKVGTEKEKSQEGSFLLAVKRGLARP